MFLVGKLQTETAGTHIDTTKISLLEAGVGQQGIEQGEVHRHTLQDLGTGEQGRGGRVSRKRKGSVRE